MAFRKAEKCKSKLRLGITGPAGSGKTYSALLLAQGLGGRIALIDTENGSGDLYSDLCDYDICNISAPYDVRKYLSAIHDAENERYDIIIIDSLSHAWAGDGGLLDMQGKIVDSSRSGNSYTAWRQVTPLHNKLVEAMITSPAHIIATMRSKMDYMQDKDEKGKSVVRKIGLAPVQRDGIEYEFSLVFDLNVNHLVSVSKDRTSLFDGQNFVITPDTGVKLKDWLETGTEVTPWRNEFEERKKSLYNAWLRMLNGNAELAKNMLLEITGGKPSVMWDVEDLLKIEVGLQQFAIEAGLQAPEATSKN